MSINRLDENEITNYKCVICSENYNESLSLEAHLEKQHLCKHNSDDLGCSGNECPKCQKNFLSTEKYIQHLVWHSDQRDFICENCGKAFTTQIQLTNHAKTHKYTSSNFECGICGKYFRTENNLRNHTIIHSTEKPYACKNCGKTYKSLINLKTHSSYNCQAISHKCDYCETYFGTAKLLKDHVKIHVTNKQYSCAECAQDFQSENDLKNHLITTHSKMKVLNCRYCQKPFKSDEDLNRHIVFRCNPLSENKNLISKELDLNTHLETQHKLFNCRKCGSSFKSQPSLNSHIVFQCFQDFEIIVNCSTNKIADKDISFHTVSVEDQQAEANHFKKNISPRDSFNNKFVKCEQCGTFFKAKRYLKRHLLSYCKMRKNNISA